MLKQKLTALLATAAALVLLAVPAFAEDTAAQALQPEAALPADVQVPAEPEQQITYVALGDSITAGVGLSDLQYNVAQIGFDLKPNFEGYSSRCYTALVGKGLGLNRQHAINLGLPGLMSADLLDMVRNGRMPQMNQASGSYYVYPEYQDYLRNADVISIQIGSNDALVPCIVSLGEATHWKSEQLANMMVSGFLRDFNFQKFGMVLEALNKMWLTFDESSATTRLLFSMGRGKFLHPWFLKVHPKYGTPTNAVLFTLGLTLIAPFFGRSALNWIVDMSAMGTALAYLSTCLVVYKYASRFADQTPWWSKSVAVVGALTSIACFLMLAVPGSPAAIGVESWIMLLAWVAIGACFYFSRASILRSIPETSMQYMLLGTADRPLLFTPKAAEEEVFEEDDAKSAVELG